MAVAEREVRLIWKGPVSPFMRDEAPEIDLEGALSSGKTTACLWKEYFATQQHAGIHGYIGRYGDGETQTKIRPAWEAVLRQAGARWTWNAKENSYDFSNGSRVYAFGLKSPDERSRYSKVRGMGVSRIYVDQTEELPEDIGLELRGRLRQPGFPHQLTFSPNPQNVTHWLAAQFPEDNRVDGRHYYAVSLYDNAHHLPPDFIATQERTYPADHAKYRSVILGKRGVNVIGEPVYKGAFQRRLHTATSLYDPRQVLLESIDFGKKHPCIVWAQQTYTGGWRLVGGLLGQDLFLDDFLQTIGQIRSQWFPELVGRQTCCDPAGSHQNSQGTRFNGVDLLKKAGFAPVWKDNANAPDVRLACVESLSAHMRRREPAGTEAFLVESDPARWLRVSAEGTTADGFVTDALEAGYVWDEHLVSVGNKQVRKPKKDGWFEHGMNCFSGDTRVVTADGLRAIRDLVGAGDLTVLSRCGAWVKASARHTRVAAPMLRLGFADGTVVVCTPDHRFLSPTGWKTAENMRGASCYNAVSQTIQAAHVLSSLTGASIGDLAPITSGPVSAFTERYGKPLTALCLSDTTYTIKTTTKRTMTCPIWSVSGGTFTAGITAPASLGLRPPATSSSPAEPGMQVPRAWCGTDTITRPLAGMCSTDEHPEHVPGVGRCLTVGRRIKRGCSVLRAVGRRIAKRAAWTLSNGSAWCAGWIFLSIATLAHRLVGDDAKIDGLVLCVSVESAENADAYCLDVPGARAFCIESGLVVHNCLEYLELNFGATRATQEERDQKLAKRRASQARLPRLVPGELWG